MREEPARQQFQDFYEHPILLLRCPDVFANAGMPSISGERLGIAEKVY